MVLLKRITTLLASCWVFLTVLLASCSSNNEIIRYTNNRFVPIVMPGRFWEVAILLKSGTTNIDEVWSNINVPIIPLTTFIPDQNSFAQQEEIVLKYPIMSWVDIQRLKESLFQSGQVEYIRITQINHP